MKIKNYKLASTKVLLLFLFTITLSASNMKNSVFIERNNIEMLEPAINAYEIESNNVASSTQKIDCTITISTKKDDGTLVKGKITFINITRWQCVKIKVANFIYKLKN